MENSFVFQIFVDFELDFLGAFGVGLELAVKESVGLCLTPSYYQGK